MNHRILVLVVALASFSAAAVASAMALPDYTLANAQPQKSGLTDEDIKTLDEIVKKVNENSNKTTAGNYIDRLHF